MVLTAILISSYAFLLCNNFADLKVIGYKNDNLLLHYTSMGEASKAYPEIKILIYSVKDHNITKEYIIIGELQRNTALAKYLDSVPSDIDDVSSDVWEKTNKYLDRIRSQRWRDVELELKRDGYILFDQYRSVRTIPEKTGMKGTNGADTIFLVEPISVRMFLTRNHDDDGVTETNDLVVEKNGTRKVLINKMYNQMSSALHMNWIEKVYLTPDRRNIVIFTRHSEKIYQYSLVEIDEMFYGDNSGIR